MQHHKVSVPVAHWRYGWCSFAWFVVQYSPVRSNPKESRQEVSHQSSVLYPSATTWINKLSSPFLLMIRSLLTWFWQSTAAHPFAFTHAYWGTRTCGSSAVLPSSINLRKCPDQQRNPSFAPIEFQLWQWFTLCQQLGSGPRPTS